MPGWYIHLDVARKALGSLTEAQSRGYFGAGAPSPAELSRIATSNPAYTALGAIGPDFFFLLPDFKPGLGSSLRALAAWLIPFYQQLDEDFIGPYEDQLQPVLMSLEDDAAAFTGDLSKSFSDLFSQAMKLITQGAEDLATRLYDLFGLLSSGVPEGYDEHVFYWSDMLHYRKTYDFAAQLWNSAVAAGDDRFKAFALGWMTHLATDVTGHCFVNEKCGGPYRVHWQRHHLVENHMDARVYDSEKGTGTNYEMLSCAALHLWICVDPTKATNFFTSNGPPYPTGDDRDSFLKRRQLWDIDSAMPEDLAKFLQSALMATYPDGPVVTAPGALPGTEAEANHPKILDGDPTAGIPLGFPTVTDIVETTYFLLYKYVKATTTDYYQMLPPSPPKVWDFPEFPAYPGEYAPGPIFDGKPTHDAMEILLAILAWLLFLFDVILWGLALLAAAVLDPITYEPRKIIYEYLQLPVYNAWLALHWYFAMLGFTSPMKSEINPGLMTLGVSAGDVDQALEKALSDPKGGLTVPTMGTEPSGADKDTVYPHGAMTDPPSVIMKFVTAALGLVGVKPCSGGEAPTEFLHPWNFPLRDQQGDSIPSEQPLTHASPFASTLDATALMVSSPGSAAARTDFEGAQHESDTLSAQALHLPRGEHLGDPVDYSWYVIGKLTNPDTTTIANFNLDADRGLGYLCWDWVRTSSDTCTPQAYKGATDPHSYRAPVAAGYGWCSDDLVAPTPTSPAMYDAVHGGAVRIRYIDLEKK